MQLSNWCTYYFIPFDWITIMYSSFDIWWGWYVVDCMMNPYDYNTTSLVHHLAKWALPELPHPHINSTRVPVVRPPPPPETRISENSGSHHWGPLCNLCYTTCCRECWTQNVRVWSQKLMIEKPIVKLRNVTVMSKVCDVLLHVLDLCGYEMWHKYSLMIKQWQIIMEFPFTLAPLVPKHGRNLQ